MKEINEPEIESGVDRPKSTILYDVLEKHRVERWIEDIINRPRTLQYENPSYSIPESKENSGDD